METKFDVAALGGLLTNFTENNISEQGNGRHHGDHRRG